MALASCRYITGSPCFSPNLSDGLQDVPSASCFIRVIYLHKDAFGRKRSQSGDPFPPHAVKLFSSSHVVSCQRGLPVVSVEERNSQPTHTLQAMEVNEREVDQRDENLWTELKRSQLESQWACGDEQHRLTHCVDNEYGRLSARQRRIMARKHEASIHLQVTSPTLQHIQRKSVASSSRVGKGKSLEEALETVNTLGLLRGSSKKALLTKQEETLLSKKIKVGRNLRAFKEKMTKTLGHEPSNDLWAIGVKLSPKDLQTKLIEADRARDYMFVSNLRLVVSVAKKYSSLGINLADLTQDGAMGLLRGLDKFDHKRGFKLSTYVHWWIRQGITQALGDHSKTVRIPPYMYTKLMLVTGTMTKLKEEGRPASLKALCEALNMPKGQVSMLLKFRKKITSIDRPQNCCDSDGKDLSLHNCISDMHAENNPWNVVDRMFLREYLEALLSDTLSVREQKIVRQYYGFDCPKQKGVSLQQIGDRMGICRERARQVERHALRKLAAAGRKIGFDVPLSC